MASEQKTPKVAVVAGDVTIDWNLARKTRRRGGVDQGWNADDCTRACWQPGGAALLADLVEAVAAGLHESGQGEWIIRRPPIHRDPIHPGDRRFHHSYAMWSLFKYGEKPPHDKEKPAWRVEEYLGLDCCLSPQAREVTEGQEAEGDSPEAELVTLDDANLGFRDLPHHWPWALTAEGSRPWVLLKMARPIAQGPLWEHLLRNHSDRLVVAMTVNDLRRTEVQITRELSWERTAQDLAWELVHNPRVNALSRCAHVVVSFDTAGALLLSRLPQESGTPGSMAPNCFLFFDPKVIEGMWQQDHPGGMIGYTSCLAAEIARQLMLAPDRPDLHQGIQTGLSAMRRLHLEGYGERGASAAQASLAFPIGLVTAEAAKGLARFTVARVQDPVRLLTEPGQVSEETPESGYWTILHDRYSNGLDEAARRVVLEGPETALQGVPIGRFGGLLTVDRREIESFRSVRTLVSEYCRQGQARRPLSIAVFGAPGSGKSFGITQVAKSLLPGQIEVLEFNLSQFRSAEEMVDALHVVRDVGLSGKIPLVFWDEFDSSLGEKPLGWLRYFLAPMQDGSFREGQVTHPIGRAIFVFAGGTSDSMERFSRRTGPDAQGFRDAKGPDFVSRLKGYVDVLGPNPRESAHGGQPAVDPYHVLRRAILLRSILQRSTPQLFRKQDGVEVLSIDPGVLRAFLQTRQYRHGARSMEAIVAMSLLSGRTTFERSCLPAESQLDLHVDGRDFLSLAQQIELEGDLLERLAEAAHEVYCEGKRRDGWKLGPRNDVEKTHPLLIPYADLTETYKEANQATVRGVPRKLAAAGYVMMPARSNESPLDFPGDDLEKLARLEHERWRADRLAAGFVLGEPCQEDPKRSPYLIDWEELPEEIKQIDRDLVRGIPRILARAGCAVVKLRREAER